MCCYSIVLCSSYYPLICRSSPSLSLSVYIECSQFVISAVGPLSFFIFVMVCHDTPDVMFSVLFVLSLISEGVTMLESFGPGNDKSLAYVTYTRLLYPLTHLTSLEWWSGFHLGGGGVPLQLTWGAPVRAGCVWPLYPISGGGANKCTTNQQNS